MKIILTSESTGLDSELDPRFGRAGYFLLVDTDTLEYIAMQNPGATASGGAGVQAAQFVTSQDIQAVISSDFGPHAFNALEAAGVSMYLFGTCRTPHQAIERFKSGLLEPLRAPARRGHRR